MVQVNPQAHEKNGTFVNQLVCLFFLLLIYVNIDTPAISKHTAHLGVSTLQKSTNVIPNHDVIENVDVLWAAPDNNPEGILFLAHGCSHSHTDWFVSCEQGCLGLPEEVAIVNFALKRNLIVVAVSSENRRSKCWNIQTDGPRVANVLIAISKRNKNPFPLPIYAFGASSGGRFVSFLNEHIEIQGFLSQIMATESPAKTDCMVYLTMNKDEASDISAAEILAGASDGKHIRLPPLPLKSDTFFSDRISRVSIPRSKSMVQSLRDNGWLDNDGYLIYDPRRRSDWRELFSQYAGNDSMIADKSPISEVMNVAFGLHEMSREGVEEGLDFCMTL